jgi:hypothetical protein
MITNILKGFMEMSPALKVGDMIVLPFNSQVEVLKVTEYYVIFDVIGSEPIKYILKQD